MKRLEKTAMAVAFAGEAEFDAAKEMMKDDGD